MQNYRKLYECRAAALPRLNKLMEGIDPNFYWSVQETPQLTPFLIDKRNNSWGNDPTPAQALALSAFRQEVSLRMRDDFAFEACGALYMLDADTEKAEIWLMNDDINQIRNGHIEEAFAWKHEEIGYQTAVKVRDFFGLPCAANRKRKNYKY